MPMSHYHGHLAYYQIKREEEEKSEKREKRKQRSQTNSQVF